MAIAGIRFHKTEIKRYNKLLSVLMKYGFKDIVANSDLKKYIPKSFLTSHKELDKNLSFSKYERVRMVLEELGPTYIKLGQIFSNREDLFPKELTTELEKLQDHAPPLENFSVIQTVEEELNIKASDHFEYIYPEPLAAASLAQVHKAILKNGDLVILKIQRPNITETIESDILVMKQLAKSLAKYSEQAKSFQPQEIVNSFEKSIKEELRFSRELNNVERFAKNFENNTLVYVPKIYRDLSNDHIICMEYINGIKISNIEEIDAMGIDRNALAKIGVDLYLEQVLEHGFFHADPHPGNLFLLPGLGKICFVDFGMMGSLTSTDSELLEDLLFSFVKKDASKIIVTVEKIALTSNIPNRKKLENDINEFLHESENYVTLKDIKLNVTLNEFKKILSHNQIILPHYFYMLIRALIIIEALGQKLDPEFNILDNIKPYLQSIGLKRISPNRILKKSIKRFQNLNRFIDTIPDDLDSIIQKVKKGELKVVHDINGLDAFRTTLNIASNRVVLAIILAALSIGSALLVIADMPPRIYGVPALGLIGFIISGILGLIVIYSIIRKKIF
ncbi:ubiquinone biosynthesis protein [Saonia flava]|uniref:Ubiquinone biosynthesis protein n=1 Tax=Saonia flava TaxID=523696 RepID=A0A846QT55_9FLAO|nr:AarF/UbiB family protein [Saonia flava]NJB72146.1 ubiquinone biosynthesis protein [Saonia flava]